MDEKELFMVHTDDIYLKGYESTMAEALKKNYIKFNGKTDYRELIPFMKTGKRDNEYIELITGTLFYEDDTIFVTKDSLVYFTTLFNYDRVSFENLCKEYPLERLKLEMKRIYRLNKPLYNKNKSIEDRLNANQIIKKLEQKYKNR